MTRVKICCITSLKEASLAIDCGAHAIGLVSAMPSGPGIISEERISEIASVTPAPTSTFLLTCSQEASVIIEQLRRCEVTTVQFCDSVSPVELRKVRAAMPKVALVQTIHVTSNRSVDDALFAAEHVDAILLDSGKPHEETKELGGTGQTHDWSLSARIVEESPVAVFLAGGLHAGNVAEAIETVQPFGVDVCSRVRTHDLLDPDKLKAFMKEVALASS